jgi:hypothetical protein
LNSEAGVAVLVVVRASIGFVLLAACGTPPRSVGTPIRTDEVRGQPHPQLVLRSSAHAHVVGPDLVIGDGSAGDRALPAGATSEHDVLVVRLPASTGAWLVPATRRPIVVDGPAPPPDDYVPHDLNNDGLEDRMPFVRAAYSAYDVESSAPAAVREIDFTRWTLVVVGRDLARYKVEVLHRSRMTNKSLLVVRFPIARRQCTVTVPWTTMPNVAPVVGDLGYSQHDLDIKGASARYRLPATTREVIAHSYLVDATSDFCARDLEPRVYTGAAMLADDTRAVDFDFKTESLVGFDSPYRSSVRPVVAPAAHEETATELVVTIDVALTRLIPQPPREPWKPPPLDDHWRGLQLPEREKYYVDWRGVLGRLYRIPKTAKPVRVVFRQRPPE